MAESATSGTGESGDSTLTVIIAGVSNLLIAVAKVVAAMISGSSAMFSEAAHSFADTVTEVLLFIAIRRGDRPSDDTHPLGYGRESYLWALLAAGATFIAGGAASVYEGVDKILHGGDQGSPLVAFVVLGVAAVLEGASLVRAVRQVRSSARRYSVRARRLWQETTDTSVKAVTAEDTAALVGLALAALGLGLSVLTGSALWDGLSSVLIGVLLVGVAVTLAIANIRLLVGRQAPLGIDRALRAELEGLDGVESVPVFVTAVNGPRRLLVAAKVEFSDECTTDDIERVADEAERRMIQRFPGVEYVFLDPTARASRTAQAQVARDGVPPAR